MEEKEINELTTDEETAIAEDSVEDTEIVTDDDPIESEEPMEEEPKDDDVSEEEEPVKEEGAPKKKKKLKKWQIALICVGGFIGLIGIAVGLFFLIGGLLAQNIDVVQGDFHNKPPAVAITYTSDELALINNAMKENASDETIKEAIAMIYNKANQNKISCDQAITVLQGQGSARLDKFGVSGSMAVRGFKVQAGNEFYYQKAAPIVDCVPKSGQPLVSGILEQQERTYSNGVDDFRMTGALKGDEAKLELSESNPMTVQVPFVPVGVPKKGNIKSKDSYESFMEAGFYLDDPREITNFVVTPNAVVLNELKEGEKRIEKVQTEDGDVYYICRFALLVSGEGHDECVSKAREYLRVSADSEDLEYSKFEIRFEVWENGYFKMMHDEEKWVGTASGAKTSSETWYESITYYNLDAEVFTAEDMAKYKGDDWAAKVIAYYKAELDNAPKK